MLIAKLLQLSKLGSHDILFRLSVFRPLNIDGFSEKGVRAPPEILCTPRNLNAHWIKLLPYDLNKNFELNETKNKDFEPNIKFKNFL